MAQLFPDPDVCDYVLTLFASFLDGHTRDQKCHIFTGLGANGASSLLELFDLAFGKHITHLQDTIFTQKKCGVARTNFKNKRAVFIQQNEFGQKFYGGILKELCGHDSFFCCPLYGDPFECKPQFKLLYSCNHLPSFHDPNAGIFRRIDVIELKSRFVDNPDPKNRYEFKRDPNLSQKLYGWKEAFMYILLEHYKIYKKQGLIVPVAVLNRTREYQKMNDISNAYTEFVDDCLEKDPNCSIKLDQTYQIFKGWWKESFGSKIPTRNDMKAHLTSILGQYLSGSEGGWHGYKFVINNTIDQIMDLQI